MTLRFHATSEGLLVATNAAGVERVSLDKVPNPDAVADAFRKVADELSVTSTGLLAFGKAAFAFFGGFEGMAPLIALKPGPRMGLGIGFGGTAYNRWCSFVAGIDGVNRGELGSCITREEALEVRDALASVIAREAHPLLITVDSYGLNVRLAGREGVLSRYNAGRVVYDLCDTGPLSGVYEQDAPHRLGTFFGLLRDLSAVCGTLTPYSGWTLDRLDIEPSPRHERDLGV
jgi:hypothetical protein